MSWYNLLVWLAGPLVESAILVRAVRTRWIREYRFFFAYIACVLFQDILFFVVFLFLEKRYYTPVYWIGELLSAVLGAGLTYDLFRVALGRYPGAGRMARNVLAVVLIGTLFKNLVHFWTRHAALSNVLIELERDLRVTQALCVLALLGLIVYYRISLSRNARGLLSGYGIFLGSSIVTLAFRSSLGMDFQKAWVSVQPLLYLAVLCIWCAFLWDYEPSPRLEPHGKMEVDYHSLAQATRKSVTHAREFLARAVRP